MADAPIRKVGFTYTAETMQDGSNAILAYARERADIARKKSMEGNDEAVETEAATPKNLLDATRDMIALAMLENVVGHLRKTTPKIGEVLRNS